ncbi:MAG: hypothetical protein V7709_16355 [Halioglobus sp.]
MLNKVLAVALIVLGSLGFAQAISAEEAVAENATVVVYRSDRSFKAERVSMHLRLGDENLGRMNTGDNLVVSHAAGEYVVSSSVKGGKEMVINLKAGKTHYIHAEVGVRGTQVKVTFSEVEEQVAREVYPDLEVSI